MLQTSSCLSLALLMNSFCSPEGAKILLVPMSHRSHVSFFLTAGQTLVNSGHDVHMLTEDTHQQTLAGSGVDGIMVKAVKSRNFVNTRYAELEELLFAGETTNAMEIASKWTSSFVDLCKDVLENEAIMKRVRSIHFDLVVIDGNDLSGCMYLIPYKLGLKYVTFSTRLNPWSVRVPALPSVEAPWPFMYFDGVDTFWERIASLAMHISITEFSPFGISDGLIAEYAPEMPPTTYRELFLNSELWLVHAENLCLDVPRVSAPHYQFVGGITYPSKPLPPELEAFAAEAHSGLILLTLGSAIKRFPRDIVRKLMTAFRAVDYRILMRFDGDPPPHVPGNVKLAKWLPQNDILGHPKTRLFITHAGNTGQLEALYHGVPMLSMPLNSDQPMNARRSELHGYGRTINPHNFTAEDMVSAIDEMMTNNTYRDNIKRCSKIYRDFPSGQSAIHFYVEHVLKFGGSHLKPRCLHMPLWKFFMLDVLMFLLAVCSAGVIFLIFCCRRICRALQQMH